MVGWHHRLDEHEFEQVPGNSEGQGSLACCSPRGHKESDTTTKTEVAARDCGKNLDFYFYCVKIVIA